MKTYTTKFLKLEHEITETADLIDFPIITFFADKEELGSNVEISYYEWTLYDYHYTGTRLLTIAEANKEYLTLIHNGYKITEREVA